MTRFYPLIILMIICAIINFSIAGYMAINGINGWGWFIFTGVLCLTGRYRESDNK